jgi:hypothetical protein
MIMLPVLLAKRYRSSRDPLSFNKSSTKTDWLLQIVQFEVTCYRWEATVAYNLHMDNDETLDDFVKILGRIAELVGTATISDDKGADLDAAIEQLRLAGNNEDADELAGLVQQADELKSQHQAKS